MANKIFPYINSKKMSIVTCALILSLWYIGYQEFNYYIFRVASNSYSKWLEMVIKQATDKSCKPINIRNWETEVNLINIECLNQKDKSMGPESVESIPAPQ